MFELFCGVLVVAMMMWLLQTWKPAPPGADKIVYIIVMVITTILTIDHYRPDRHEQQPAMTDVNHAESNQATIERYKTYTSLIRTFGVTLLGAVSLIVGVYVKQAERRIEGGQEKTQKIVTEASAAAIEAVTKAEQSGAVLERQLDGWMRDFSAKMESTLGDVSRRAQAQTRAEAREALHEMVGDVLARVEVKLDEAAKKGLNQKEADPS